jgi:hypothetical protein
MRENGTSIVRRYLWLMTGIVIAIAGSLMWMSHSTDTGNLMDQQHIYDFSKEQIQEASSIQKLSSKKGWKYLRIEAETPTDCRIILYDKHQNVLWEQQNTAAAGTNLFEIIYGDKFKYISIETDGAVIDKMQLRMDTNLFRPSVFLPGCVLLFAGYLLISIPFLVRKKRITTEEKIGVTLLEKLYGDVGNAAGKWVYARTAGRGVRILRAVCFSVLFLQGMFPGIGRFRGLLVCLLLLVIALFTWERELKPVEWNWTATSAFVLFCISLCVSDFMVSKSVKFIGYVLLFAFGFFYFVWNQMEHRQEMLFDMLCGFTFAVLIMTALLWTGKMDQSLMGSGLTGTGDLLQRAEVYLRNLNLFGAEKENLLLRGEEVAAPNGMLQLVYRYGLLVTIPFVLLLISVVRQALHEKQGILVILTTGYVVCTCLFNIEQPLENPLWMLYYLGIGILFAKS